MNGSSVVVGVGESTYYRAGRSPESEFALTCTAIRRAAEDAGIPLSEIDGFVTYAGDRNDSLRLQTALGTGEISFTAMSWPGGGNISAMTIQIADAAITAGYAKYVVCFRGLAQGQFGRFGRPALRQYASGDAAFKVPYGEASPAMNNAMPWTRFMHEFGVTAEATCSISMASYAHAQRNPRAIRYGQPLTRDDYYNSRWIVYPYRLFDCTQENDGAAALIMTSPERAADLKQKPVYVKSAAIGASVRAGLQTTYNEPYFPYNRRKHVADQLWGNAGVGPQDVDVAQFYENFTGSTVMCISDMGFAPPDGIEEFLGNGNIMWPNGKLPMNTSGANLAEAYIHGFENQLEAVRQVRGQSTCQVDNVELSLAVGGPGAPVGSAALYSNER